MKQRLAFALIVVLFVVTGFKLTNGNESIFDYGVGTQSATENNVNEMRACWISYIDIEKNFKNLSQDDYIKAVDNMLQVLEENNLNMVYLHVHAMGDAVYPSEYLPWSVYITDVNDLSYDPLQIFIDKAHNSNIKVVGWLNPYRLSLSNTTSNIYKNNQYYEKYKSFIVEYKNYADEICLSLDPSRDETNQLIVNIVTELLSNYNLDGIHFDDYFYSEGMFDNLDEAVKRENVNI